MLDNFDTAYSSPFAFLIIRSIQDVENIFKMNLDASPALVEDDLLWEAHDVVSEGYIL